MDDDTKQLLQDILKELKKMNKKIKKLIPEAEPEITPEEIIASREKAQKEAEGLFQVQ
jgi:Skp family chaperone for outer membrane proteins